jgi:hypothetical protein
MALASTNPYTQANLDTDIEAIKDNLDAAITHAGRVKANWQYVQSLHPGKSAVDYIRDHVPYLNKNTAAAVALVEAGVMTVSDAARVTSRSQQGVSDAVAKASTGKTVDTLATVAKPTTLKTGATAPGPAIGTKKASKPIATATARPAPALLMPEEWAKVRQAISIILAADDNQVIATINGYPEAEKRKACANLMRSTAIRMNRLRKEVK